MEKYVSGKERDWMRKIQCADCGKHYDYDVDDFCPRCGSFNPPPDLSLIHI